MENVCFHKDSSRRVYIFNSYQVKLVIFSLRQKTTQTTDTVKGVAIRIKRK